MSMLPLVGGLEVFFVFSYTSLDIYGGGFHLFFNVSAYNLVNSANNVLGWVNGQIGVGSRTGRGPRYAIHGTGTGRGVVGATRVKHGVVEITVTLVWIWAVQLSTVVPCVWRKPRVPIF